VKIKVVVQQDDVIRQYSVRVYFVSYLKQSMWIDGLDLYSPCESCMKPISRHMSSPWNAARASTNGLQQGNLVIHHEHPTQ